MTFELQSHVVIITTIIHAQYIQTISFLCYWSTKSGSYIFNCSVNHQRFWCKCLFGIWNAIFIKICNKSYKIKAKIKPFQTVLGKCEIWWFKISNVSKTFVYLDYGSTSSKLQVRPKKKVCVFTVSLPTLIVFAIFD